MLLSPSWGLTFLLVDLRGSHLIDGDTGRKFLLSSLPATGVFPTIWVADTPVPPVVLYLQAVHFQALHLQALHLWLYFSSSSQRQRWTTLRSLQSFPRCLTLPRSFQPSNMMWSTTLRQKAGLQQPSMGGWTCRGHERVPEVGEAGHCLPLQQKLGLTSSHGKKGRRILTNMWRLPQAEAADQAGPVHLP